MSALESPEPEVRTTAGVVRGRTEDGLVVFRGIPFAEPPIGEARFQAPRPVRGWDGVREAYAFGPPAPQDVNMAGRSGGEFLMDTGDDWLTVNVWTPDPDPAARRPVMVWIHGGAYKLGFSGSPGYDAQHIVRDGDVVFVSLNYRLGIEGFARIDGAPANRGLLDQVAALEWVRENITAFGGDPGQVTVAGDSAGAGSIIALMAMPSAAGLFRRAVAQSVPGTFFSDALARDVATALAAEAGLSPTARELSGVDPRQLPEIGQALESKMRQYEDRWGSFAHTLSLFSPVVDGEVLPVAPWQALAGGAGRDVDLIIGHTRDECRTFLLFSGQFGKITEEQATEALRLFGPGEDGERAYRAAFPNASAEELYELVQNDWLFRMPTLHLAEAHTAGGGRAYLYELTWQSPGNGGVMRACHGLDGPLLFGTYDAHLGPVAIGPEPTAEARDLTTQIRTAWTSFATSGTPGWPAYDSQQRLTRIFDTPGAVTAYPEETSRRLWQEHVFEALPLLAD
ncbi:carboxylesterase/lipase family protein [Nonomuraea sp. NEAU-A123]|uniref:carboxylesterase/lipase family protein n=1 Tax=Nonomuraea sp. NEAU-A123 TaxID=2839649 RepID=UPI001BE3D1E6|nr:carboxylesterase family protein [Nonomuraea sp. NEAU-A123]MBT2233513.1 carboxylesterase family protein [Nonomuraea sp. NEAU-A123]